MEPETPIKTWDPQCRNCGATITDEGSTYCPNCGQHWQAEKKKRFEWWNTSWGVMLLIFGMCGACSAPFVGAGVLWRNVPQSRMPLNITSGVFAAWYVFTMILRRMKNKSVD